MARTFLYSKPGRKSGNFSASFCMSEAHRLLHDMSPYQEVGKAFGKRYKLLTFRHSVCQRPGCKAEILIGSGRGVAPELRKGSAIYGVCVGEGAPDGTGIVIGRMFTDDTRKHLSEYGKVIATKGGSFDPIAAYNLETSLKGGDKQEPDRRSALEEDNIVDHPNVDHPNVDHPNVDPNSTVL